MFGAKYTFFQQIFLEKIKFWPATLQDSSLTNYILCLYLFTFTNINYSDHKTQAFVELDIKQNLFSNNQLCHNEFEELHVHIQIRRCIFSPQEHCGHLLSYTEDCFLTTILFAVTELQNILFW